MTIIFLNDFCFKKYKFWKACTSCCWTMIPVCFLLTVATFSDWSLMKLVRFSVETNSTLPLLYRHNLEVLPLSSCFNLETLSLFESFNFIFCMLNIFILCPIYSLLFCLKSTRSLYWPQTSSKFSESLKHCQIK